MDMNMVKFEFRPYVKCVILKVDIFETKIIDECNFASYDQDGIRKFEEKYSDRNDFVSVIIDM